MTHQEGTSYPSMHLSSLNLNNEELYSIIIKNSTQYPNATMQPCMSESAWELFVLRIVKLIAAMSSRGTWLKMSQPLLIE